MSDSQNIGESEACNKAENNEQQENLNPVNNANDSCATTTIVAEEKEEAISAAPTQTRLVESPLESDLKEVLPLSPIGETAENIKKKAHNDNSGLRRGRHQKKKTATSSSNVGVIDDAKLAQESLSGKYPEGYKCEESTNSKSFHSDFQKRSADNDFSKPKKQLPHLQSNITNGKGKLFIDPSSLMVEQEKEPSLWQKLKAGILSLLGIKKKNKKNKRFHGKRYDKKWRHNKGDFKKGDFSKRKDFRNGGNNRRYRNKNRFNNNRPNNNPPPPAE